MKDNKTSIEVSLYYDKINELVDKYINEWNVKPSKLYAYLSPGNKRFDAFVEKSGLSDFKFIKKVVTDVLEDRLAMEKDGLLIFENTLIKESILSAIEPSSIEHEKVLADLYNTSLGHVNVADLDKHLYNVNDFGERFDVIIYSDDEIEKIKDNIQADFISKISDKNLSIDSVGVVFRLSDIIANDKLVAEFNDNLDYEKLMEYILKFFKSDLQKKELKHKTYKKYHIWEIAE
jgi:hypothetical protein